MQLGRAVAVRHFSIGVVGKWKEGRDPPAPDLEIYIGYRVCCFNQLLDQIVFYKRKYKHFFLMWYIIVIETFFYR